MRPETTCPTCGTKLGPLHEREALRRCDACQRPNPRGFRYCGFCAAPMETAAEQAERVEVAAPPGGWPSLSRELVELRFFLDRGELDEAFELLSILRERHPGHPALVEFGRDPGARKPRPDTQVYRVVDEVLAGSASLSASSLPRRTVPQWNAPVTEGGENVKNTRAHAPVPLGADDDEPTSRRPSPIGAEPARSGRAATDKHLGAVPVAKGGTGKRSAVKGKRGEPAAALTVAVPTLQAPKPFQGTAAAAGGEGTTKVRKPSGAHKRARQVPAAASPAKGSVRKRSIEPEPKKQRTGKKAAVAPATAPAEPVEPSGGKKRVRPHGARFGQNVLGRLGKGKG
jgi:hypothetical protein